jgi:hypothetical protein
MRRFKMLTRDNCACRAVVSVSTGFVLDPGGQVITAVYSSGAIGRLAADDVVGFVGYVKSYQMIIYSA